MRRAGHLGQRLGLAPAGERVEVVEGDFFTDPIPAGHDVAILANIAHLFSPERNRTLLRRLRQVVAPGARLLLVDLWTDPTRTTPLAAALLAGEFLVMCGEGDVYSERELRGWLYTCGWHPLRSSPLSGPWSVLVAEAV
jgi:hypothetical protein